MSNGSFWIGTQKTYVCCEGVGNIPYKDIKEWAESLDIEIMLTLAYVYFVTKEDATAFKLIFGE